MCNLRIRSNRRQAKARRGAGDNTVFLLPLSSFPSQQNLIEIQERVLLQELYMALGNELPPNPPYLKEKNAFAMAGIYLLNAGWAYHYLYNNNVYRDPQTARAGSPAFIVLAAADGLAALMTIGGLLGTALAPESQGMTEQITLIGLYAWATIKFGFAYDLVVQKPNYLHFHNRLLALGYNFDPGFKVEELANFDYKISHRKIETE